ncbi:uncharacterized protein LOC108924449 isoform X3 [Scleropages formosus]|uniref:uncharacterized protein LOC108924449 isoform X3 n=1 Tax=Scleropages formosus TaxID=113540 RepID=UPI0010FAAB78|nr:uncharacterized protein LOC108924449 isoform X3 [Scleropages formosus]
MTTETTNVPPTSSETDMTMETTKVPPTSSETATLETSEISTTLTTVTTLEPSTIFTSESTAVSTTHTSTNTITSNTFNLTSYLSHSTITTGTQSDTTAEQTTQAQQVLILLTFQLEINFTLSTLLDNQSTESKQLADTIKDEVGRVFSFQFDSFINITRVEFWNESGLVGVDIDLLFKYPEPSLCQVISTLYSLALVPSFFTFPLDPKSIRDRTTSEPSTAITTATTTTSAQSATTAPTVISPISTTGLTTTEAATTTSSEPTTTITATTTTSEPSTTITAETTSGQSAMTATATTSETSTSTTAATVISGLTTEAATTTSSEPTVTTASTATTAPIRAAFVELIFSMVMVFTEELNNITSELYTHLRDTVEFQLYSVYKVKYENLFSSVTLRSFSPGSVVVDTLLEFNASASVALPTLDEIKQTLIEAASVNNTNFTLNIIISSITVQEMAGISTVATMPVSTLATAQSVTVQTTPTSQLETTSTFATNASTSVAATTLTSITATSTATPTTTIAVVIIKLRFAMSKDFTSELSNTSSPQFQTLAAQVYLVVNQVYRDHFGNQYKGSNVTQFSKGSVVTFIDLFFSGTDPLPNSIDIVNALKQAVSNNNTLSIILDSIQINSAAGRNSVSCAVLLAALTLLLAGHL